ncbi:hypothetical protein ANTRET_LOCUS4645 [Anthophora retusa]
MDGEKSTNFSRFSSLLFAMVDDGLFQRVVLRYFPLNGNPSIFHCAAPAEAASIFSNRSPPKITTTLHFNELSKLY